MYEELAERQKEIAKDEINNSNIELSNNLIEDIAEKELAELEEELNQLVDHSNADEFDINSQETISLNYLTENISDADELKELEELENDLF
ncbi:hypothetical protein M0812_19061 [Anaeramoeba flamelloides]|uniref:Uncharacterized protein n=1 Tax=Anaeramoeba flamelloides TaxID=1746091 RepID=A0AAV7Z587_9EUKA|nr:hypothetical protein M0812_19061 [Anaeramoeba flamelloides]